MAESRNLKSGVLHAENFKANSMQQSAAWCEQVPVSKKLIEPDYYLFCYIASNRPLVQLIRAARNVTVCCAPTELDQNPGVLHAENFEANSMQQSAAWCKQVSASIKLIEKRYYLSCYIASKRPLVCGSKWLHRLGSKFYMQNTPKTLSNSNEKPHNSNLI